MRVDVFLTPADLAPADLEGRTAVVIDVLRASSTIVAALAAGARTIFPVPSTEDALRLANTLGRADVLLCGERKALPIEGFDLGNSPGEFSADRIAGKTLIMTTTNGTVALAAAAPAERILVASLLNLGAVAAELARSEQDVVVICSGRERRFALEDAVCAGALLARLGELRPDLEPSTDGAHAAIALAGAFPAPADSFDRADGGRDLIAAGLGDDLEFCARVDALPLVPALADRQIAALAIAAEPAAR